MYRIHVSCSQGSCRRSPLHQIVTKCFIWRVKEESNPPNFEYSLSILVWVYVPIQTIDVALHIQSLHIIYTILFIDIQTEYLLSLYLNTIDIIATV